MEDDKETDRLLFGLSDNFDHFEDDTHLINDLARTAILRTDYQMFEEPLNVTRCYRYFQRAITRTQFHNFIAGRCGCSFDRCLNLLIANHNLRLSIDLETPDFGIEQCGYLQKLIRQSGTRTAWLEWLLSTVKSDTSTVPLQVYGATNSELSSSVLLATATESASAT